MQVLSAVGLAAVLFASTNIDDLFLLLLFFGNRNIQTRHVVMGQFLGIGAVTLLSAIFGFASIVVAPAYLSWLGVVPVALGLQQLIKAVRHRNVVADAPSAKRSGILYVAALTISHCGDNIAAYMPVFANSGGTAVAIYVVIFMVMTGLWCIAAHSLTQHPVAARVLARVGHWVTPFVLIGLGLWILSGLLVRS